MDKERPYSIDNLARIQNHLVEAFFFVPFFSFFLNKKTAQRQSQIDPLSTLQIQKTKIPKALILFDTFPMKCQSFNRTLAMMRHNVRKSLVKNVYIYIYFLLFLFSIIYTIFIYIQVMLFHDFLLRLPQCTCLHGRRVE